MTTGNETNAGQTWGAPIHIWVFSYLPCDRRDRILFRTARRNYYPAAWEFATAREPKHYNIPFRKFLRLSKPRSWTGDPEHVIYRSISLGPLAHAGIRYNLSSSTIEFPSSASSSLPYLNIPEDPTEAPTEDINTVTSYGFIVVALSNTSSLPSLNHSEVPKDTPLIEPLNL